MQLTFTFFLINCKFEQVTSAMGESKPQSGAGPPGARRMDHWISLRSLANAIRRQSVLVPLVAALLLASYASGQPATGATGPLGSVRMIEETAHLKRINNSKGHVNVYRGPITGTFDMTITLTFHGSRRGSFLFIAPKGTLSGNVEITSAIQVPRHGRTIVIFEATGSIGRGTLAYRGYYSRHLKVSGTVKHGGIIDMTVRGHLHRNSRGRRSGSEPRVR